MATGVVNSALYVKGPGIMWVADLSATVPALDSTVVTASKYPTTAPTGFLPVGSTGDGFSFSDSVKTDNIEAAESFYPVSVVTTGRGEPVTFDLQEINKSNLLYALNTGTSNAVTSGTGATTATVISPPTPGQEIRRMWLWQSEDDTVRWLIYQALNTGSISPKFTKGATAASLSFSLTYELPAAQPVPYRIGLAGTVRGA